MTEWSDHVLIAGWCRGHISKQFLQGFSLHRLAVAVEQPSIEEQFHHLGDAAGIVQVNGHVTTAGLEVTDHRDPLTDSFEIIDAKVHPCGARNRQEMQHCIGGTTNGHDHADGVFKCLFGEKVQGPDVGLHRFDQDLRRTCSTIGLFLIFRCHG